MRLYERHDVTAYFLLHSEQEFVEKYMKEGEIYRRTGLYREDERFSADTIGLALRAGEFFSL